ncbi:hypothetical protein C8R42DRAFT_719715 [Lentinula raphanica]|nr:hypothetical protein C8R42DRAFT_719715 [Lentinula raphanica]
MPPTIGYTCKGCHGSWKRNGDLTQHHIKTTDPRCRQAANDVIAQLRRSQSGPRHPLPFHLRRISNHNHPPTSPPAQQQSSAAETSTSKSFTGDFFGNDYTSEDFPGFNDSTSEGHSDSESDSNENDTTQMEQHWEPPRPVRRSDMDVDIEENPDLEPRNPLLQGLPTHRKDIHVQAFGGRAGAPLPGLQHRATRDSGDGYGWYQSHIPGSKKNMWAPFTSKMDWEFAHWAKLRGTGSTAFSDLLAIEGVGEALGLSYCNSQELDSIIDKELPSRRPAFIREEVVIAGQALDIYRRDILECIQALYGNPDHSQYLCFTPERHYADADKTIRLYHDFNTGKWWWDTQKAVEADKPGATIIPVILSSDKTQVTLFRNKSAYPVYLTIGNLPKEIRQKPSQQGQILLAYLPTSCLEHITSKTTRRRSVTNLFHACMKHLVAPLEQAGLDGTIMESGDGVKRRVHPILASYIGDYPEQTLVTMAYYGDCATCLARKDELEIYPCEHPYRDIEAVLDAVGTIGTDDWVRNCRRVNIKPVQHPFWENLPYTNIFASITPDILHQLHQGVMKHLISWLTAICGADEIDARVRRLPPNHSIRIFHKGISTLSRVSGTEHKQMASFILGVITDIPSLTPNQSNILLAATRALLDFLYLASYPIHSSESLALLEKALDSFHRNRNIFIELKVRANFNLPKLHFLAHYVRAIKYYGTTDNYNTETTERLHIDLAKDAYRASNHKDEYAQMTRWLERREKIFHHTDYVAWRLSSATVHSNLDYHSHGPSFTPTSALTPALSPHVVTRQDFPGAQRTLGHELEDTGPSGYHAVRFEHTLKRFLVQYRDPSVPINQLDDYARFVVLPFSSLPVWHKVKFINPALYGSKTLDYVCAQPCRYNGDGKVVHPSQFDTALLRLKDDSGNWVKDTRIGRIRVIFSIPNNRLDTLLPTNVPLPTHLAYVEWFTKFSRSPEAFSGLYRVKRNVLADGKIAASILPLESIMRSVHLFPKWGGSVPPEWTSESVLDEAPSFTLNVFKDNRSYFNLS